MARVDKATSDKTRQRILTIAAAEIYENGFRATGLNDILKKSGLTKGAFYHHFKSKSELGVAIAEEVVDKAFRELWIKPLEKSDANTQTIIDSLQYAIAANNSKDVTKGCPLANLTQEMANQDQKICAVLRRTVDDWRQQLANVLKREQDRGLLRSNVDCDQSSYFIISSLQGAIGLAKPYHDPRPFRSALRALIDYLKSLTNVDRVAA